MTQRQGGKAHLGRLRWVNSDHVLAALLLFLVLYGFVIYPLARTEGRANIFAALSFSLVLVLGVLATTKHKAVRWGMVVLSGLTFTSHWLHFYLREDAVLIHIISAGAAVLFFAALSWLIIARVFRGGGINIYRIYGAIAVYLLLGILWGEIYVVLYLVEPASFYFNPATQCQEPPLAELIYFSFSTLTTLGLGEIVPAHPMARSMTTLEALIGQLYPAILLARLVTLYQK